MIKRATKKQTKVAMDRNTAIINEVRKLLRSKGYRFIDDIVGSRKFNTILVEDGSTYDIDVRIFLTRNTKQTDAQIIFDDFEWAFTQLQNNNLIIEFGTQAIKCFSYNQNKLQYIIEYVISREGERIMLNKPQKVRQWHQMKESYEEAYERFEEYDSEEKDGIIQEYVLPLKIVAREKDDDKPSIALFVEGLNNYENKR